MSAVATTRHYDWYEFWDELDRAEEVWATKLDEDGRCAFEAAVKSMVRASVHPGHREELHRAWDKCRVGGVSPWYDGDLCWNLRCVLNHPHAPTRAGVEEILGYLRGSYEEGGTDSAPDWAAVEAGARAFIDRLQYAVLATMWQFTRCCSAYLEALPASVREELDGDLYDLVLRELLDD